jgi:outer membrane immunogenic protein
MKRLGLGTVTAIALAIAATGSTQAADMALKAPIASIYNWTGFYLGANIGGGWGNRGVGYAANDPASAALFAPGVASGFPPSASFTSSGAVGGVQFGYNWQVSPKWVVGVETDFNGSDIKGSGATSPLLLAPLFSATADEHIRWFGTVRGRLGFVPTDRLLAYVTGGFAYGRVEHSASYINNSAIPFGIVGGAFSFTCNAAATCFTGSSNSLNTGWTAGAGFEYALLNNLTLKAEYLYVDLGSNAVTETALVRNGNAPATALSSFNAGYSRTNLNVARVGLNYRF